MEDKDITNLSEVPAEDSSGHLVITYIEDYSSVILSTKKLFDNKIYYNKIVRYVCGYKILRKIRAFTKEVSSIDGVYHATMDQYSVHLTKADLYDWDDILNKVVAALSKHFKYNVTVVFGNAPADSNKVEIKGFSNK